MGNEALLNEIDAMIKAGHSTEVPGTETPGTEAPGTEVPSTKVPGTEVPSTGAPSTKVPSTEAPTTTAPTTEAPEDPVIKELREQNELLRQQVESQKKPPSTKAPSTEAPIEDIDFLGDEVDLDELTRNASLLNKVLNKVHKAGIEAGRRMQGDTLKGIPDIVKNNVVIQSTLKKKVTDFYDSNPDLAGFKKVVSAVYEELQSEHPDWNLNKIFSETEKETRKRLNLKKKATTTTAPTTAPPRGKPNFAKVKGSNRRQKPKTDSLLSEIDAMNENR